MRFVVLTVTCSFFSVFLVVVAKDFRVTAEDVAWANKMRYRNVLS